MAGKNHPESALTESLAMVFLIFLILAMSVITAAVLFGFLPPLAKSGYLVPKADLASSPSGSQVILLRHTAGDRFTLNASAGPEGLHQLGLRIENGSTSRPVAFASSLTDQSFVPGNLLYIYQAGTGYLATDTPSSIPTSGSISGRNLTLILTDDTAKTLIARISLGNATVVTTTPATPVPTPTPLVISAAYLNAAKGSSLAPGGTYSFAVTGLYSSITLGGINYPLNSGDTVALSIGSDGLGTLYATSSQISTFSFDDIGLTINGVFKGRGSVDGIWISGYSGQSSTLALVMPSASGWTNFRVDGTTLISGINATSVQVSGIKAPMNLLTASSSTYYDGAASGYSLG